MEAGSLAYIVRMGSHRHHEHSGSRLVEEAKGVLTTAGEQWTDMRADVFAALAEHERPASAYDIAEEVGRRRGKRVAPNSVYRILDLFVRNNLANRIESANAYLANTHPGCRHDCIFLTRGRHSRAPRRMSGPWWNCAACATHAPVSIRRGARLCRPRVSGHGGSIGAR